MKETLEYSNRPSARKEPDQQSKVQQMMVAMIITNERVLLLPLRQLCRRSFT